MKYVALGDSISIDKYTGVVGGGAASQFAAKLGAEFRDLTRDGNVTTAVLIDMERITGRPDVVTLTAGGNDFLVGRPVDEILATLEEYERLNNSIRKIARERGFLLSDLQELFRGNGLTSANPWICCEIEPNYLGATAIAAHWMGLLKAHRSRS